MPRAERGRTEAYLDVVLTCCAEAPGAGVPAERAVRWAPCGPLRAGELADAYLTLHTAHTLLHAALRPDDR